MLFSKPKSHATNKTVPFYLSFSISDDVGCIIGVANYTTGDADYINDDAGYNTSYVVIRYNTLIQQKQEQCFSNKAKAVKT